MAIINPVAAPFEKALNSFDFNNAGTVADFVKATLKYNAKSTDTGTNLPVTAETVTTPTLPPVALEQVPMQTVPTMEPGPVFVNLVGPSEQSTTSPNRPDTIVQAEIIKKEAAKVEDNILVRTLNRLRAQTGVVVDVGQEAVTKAKDAAEEVEKKLRNSWKNPRADALAVNQENPSLANSDNRVNQLSKYFGTEMGMHDSSLKSIGQSITGILNTILSIPSQIINAVLGAVRDFINAVVSGIQALIAPLVSVLQTAIGGVLNLVGGTINGLVNGILGPIANVTSAVKSEIDAVTQARKRYVSGATKPAPSNADPSLDSLTEKNDRDAINKNGKVIPVVVSADGTRVIVQPNATAEPTVGGIG